MIRVDMSSADDAADNEFNYNATWRHAFEY
jgi:hypothetical protein